MLKRIMSLILAIGLVGSMAWADGSLLINGAGSTFVYPALTKLFDEYSKINPNAQFNYQSIGSGGGIKQITAKTVDFGATDGPMTQDQMTQAPGRIYHLPIVMGAEAIVYNLPGVDAGLKLTPDILAGIYLGHITQWNDPLITAQNPGVNLPSSTITVAHRSDGSGTTYIFVDYLSSVSPEWKGKVGKGTSVNWPVGLGGKGNEGVAGIVKQSVGSIGYVELAYAKENNLTYANMQNKSGNFIEPTLDSTSQAAVGMEMPADLRVSIVNSSNPQAYPICGFSWLLVYKHNDDATKGKAIVDFVKWAITDGQQYLAALYYAPLPSDVVQKEQSKLARIN